MQRRTFITGLLASPAIVRASSLEYVPRSAYDGWKFPENQFGAMYPELTAVQRQKIAALNDLADLGQEFDAS